MRYNKKEYKMDNSYKIKVNPYYEFIYPEAFEKLLELQLVDFDLWYLMTAEQAMKRLEGLKERYPSRRLIPFARRDGNDDIACFEVGKDSSIRIIHDFASTGFEQKSEYNDLWEWVLNAVREMAEYNR